MCILQISKIPRKLPWDVFGCREAGSQPFAVALPGPAMEEMVGVASENCKSITPAVPREWSVVRTQSS